MLKYTATGIAFFLAAAMRLDGQQFQDQTAARFPAQSVWTESVATGDIDGDGDVDVVFGRGDGFSSAGTARQNAIYVNNGAGVFADQTATRLPVQLSNTKDVELLDVDADGDLDLVVANGFAQQPRLYLNGGTGVFSDATAANFPILTINSFSIVGGDVDNDGDIDLLFNDSGASTYGAPGGQPRLFINDGTGHFVDRTALQFPAVNVQAAVESDLVDVDGDWDLDLIVVSRDASPSKLFLNNGAGFFSAGPVLPADGGGTYDYTVGDLDGDADADIFVIGQSGLSEGVFLNNGSGSYAIAAGAVVGNPSSDDNVASFGDIDNDGDFDVAIAALSTPDRILVNNAAVFTYNAGLITAVTDSSLDGAFADVDGDGDLDLIQAIGESGAFQNRLYINATGGPDTIPPMIRIQNPGPGALAGAIPIRCAIRDVVATKSDPQYQSVVLHYAVNGSPGSAAMRWAGADQFRGVIPFAPVGAAVTAYVAATDRHGTTGSSPTVMFSPTGVPAAPLLLITTTGVGDATIVLYSPMNPGAEEFLFASTMVPPVLGSGPFLGLGVDAFNIIFTPPGIPPLHDYLGPSGYQATSFGPGSLPAGFTFDARGAIVASPAPLLTNIVRMTM